MVKKIVHLIRTLCQVGVALSTSHCRGLIVGVLRQDLPEIFAVKEKDGSMFKCSDSWVQTFLYDQLQYTMRKGT
ncbi:hypothetical protein EV702DRAFT_978535 [Suillus placidus]|uniref:Uncharacterized protein n=1 Tax=Suillus placidus TaxID=48579 RepID=A0A9P7CX15_9AGAM|nr:hypothetical protein EV702DRAFT_978535 [Suillus placidus]